MKKRHLKTIIERYCEPCRFQKRDNLISYSIELNKQLHFYRNSINKTETPFDLNDALNFCNIKTKGVFYLQVDFAEWLLYEDTPISRMKLKKRDGYYAKFYVLEGSVDGHILVWYFNIHNQLDYDFFDANRILLEGNIGVKV